MIGSRYWRWVRVTRKSPCMVCGKPDFCTFAPEHETVCCMRVESDRPSKNAFGGWLHKIGGDSPLPAYIPPVKVLNREVDLKRLWRRWFDETDPIHRDGFAMSIGVDTQALVSLGCAWTGKAWAFPMRNEFGEIIGIRLRNEEGRKWAVTGSRSGLFVPSDCDKTAWICEGPTDTAAALSLGLFGVGRPSCLGQEEMISAFLKQQGVRRVAILADNDEPGQRGAHKLKAALKISSCIWSPPTKDLREFVLFGGTRQLIEAAVKDLVWSSGPAGYPLRPDSRTLAVANRA